MLCSLDVQGADLPIDDVAVFLKLWSNFDQILFPIPTRSQVESNPGYYPEGNVTLK